MGGDHGVSLQLFTNKYSLNRLKHDKEAIVNHLLRRMEFPPRLSSRRHTPRADRIHHAYETVHILFLAKTKTPTRGFCFGSAASSTNCSLRCAHKTPSGIALRASLGFVKFRHGKRPCFPTLSPGSSPSHKIKNPTR